MKKYNRVIVSAMLPVILWACDGSQQINSSSLEKKLSEDKSKSLSEINLPYIHGFGKIEREESFPIPFHNVYRTSSEHYICQMGGNRYVVDGNTGQLLTHGAHFIRLKDNKFVISIGGDINTPDTIPKSYLEFTESELTWMKGKFDERNNGLYVRNFKVR